MMKNAQSVLADALQLDADARADVAVELLASLDGPADQNTEAVWAAEIAAGWRLSKPAPPSWNRGIR